MTFVEIPQKKLDDEIALLKRVVASHHEYSQLQINQAFGALHALKWLKHEIDDSLSYEIINHG